jgi:hypothetical protein
MAVGSLEDCGRAWVHLPMVRFWARRIRTTNASSAPLRRREELVSDGKGG